MQFNPETLQKLLSQSDERLWETIRKIGAMNGVSIPTAMPPEADMQKLRMLLGGAKQENYEDAVRLVDNYRRKQGH